MAHREAQTDDTLYDGTIHTLHHACSDLMMALPFKSIVAKLHTTRLLPPISHT